MAIKKDDQKLGLIALVAVVVSSMIGSGVDSLPQNMASESAMGPILIAWIISGFGMYFIARTFMTLSNIRPDLQAGIYMYAREGFGPLSAFSVAWGYWLMTILSNVAFAIMVMDTLNYFLPGDFRGGNNIPSLIGASILVWGVYFLVLTGTKMVGIVNTIGTLVKLIPLVVFVVVVVYFLDYSQLTNNIWGHTPPAGEKPLGNIRSQTFTPLYVALWCFIGVEGAVALSAKARNKKDIGRATFIGFMIALVVCVLFSILPFGILPQHQLSLIPNPSSAGVMKYLTGNWGEWLINSGVIISILISWLAWTMICAEIPHVAGKNGTFPKAFAKKNANDAASFSLLASSVIMQIVIVLIYFSKDAWLTLLGISAICVLPAYFASAAYLFKLCWTHEYDQYQSNGRFLAMAGAIIGVMFCLFMLYASELKFVIMTPLLLTVGAPFFFLARKQNSPNDPALNKAERMCFYGLLAIDAIIILLFATGYFTL